jgi:hypothetical protein
MVPKSLIDARTLRLDSIVANKKEVISKVYYGSEKFMELLHGP